jgi:hypothetical protein
MAKIPYRAGGLILVVVAVDGKANPGGSRRVAEHKMGKLIERAALPTGCAIVVVSPSKHG